MQVGFDPQEEACGDQTAWLQLSAEGAYDFILLRRAESHQVSFL